MARKSKDTCTFYPLTDPKHCRKRHQEDSPEVEVRNLVLLLWVSFPKKCLYRTSVCGLFVHGRYVRATNTGSRLTRVLPLTAIYTVYTGQDKIILYCVKDNAIIVYCYCSVFCPRNTRAFPILSIAQNKNRLKGPLRKTAITCNNSLHAC